MLTPGSDLLKGFSHLERKQLLDVTAYNKVYGCLQ